MTATAIDQLQKLLNTGVLHAPDPAQTSAATSFPHSNPLPPAPTRAAKNYLKAEKEQREKDAKQQQSLFLTEAQ